LLWFLSHNLTRIQQKQFSLKQKIVGIQEDYKKKLLKSEKNSLEFKQYQKIQI